MFKNNPFKSALQSKDFVIEQKILKSMKEKPNNILNISMTGVTIGEYTKQGIMKVQDLLNAVDVGTIYGYDNNRGNGRLDWTRVRSYAAKYNVDGLNTITIADMEDGTYKQADGHHRVEAMLLKNGTSKSTNAKKILYTPFTKKQLDQNIVVHVIPKSKFLEVYSLLNSGKSHSIGAMIKNEDLGIGKIMKEFKEAQEIESSLQDKFLPMLQRCIYGYIGKLALDNPAKQTSFPELSKERRSLSTDAGLTVDQLNLSFTPRQKQVISEAIDYVNMVYGEFKEIVNLSKRDGTLKLNNTSSAILRNASLYGFFIWDKLAEREEVTYFKRPRELAMRLAMKDAQIEKQAKLLMNNATREESAKMLVDYITTKKRV